eukprot:1166677-Amphidinium_carterae.1
MITIGAKHPTDRLSPLDPVAPQSKPHLHRGNLDPCHRSFGFTGTLTYTEQWCTQTLKKQESALLHAGSKSHE